MGHTHKILFVDDHPDLLLGLKRILRPMREEWNMEFASGGKEALQQAQNQCFDVIVTDMRMPDLDGAALLHEIRRVCPFAVRIALSGQAKEDTIVKALGNAHQFLSKPCDTERLKSIVKKACKVRDLLGEHWLKEKIAAIDSIPCLPHNLNSLKKILSSNEPSISQIIEIVSRDIGMTAKVLHSVNSAFFGNGTSIYSAEQAIKILGVETLRSLVNKSEIFSNKHIDPSMLSLNRLTEHCIAVANRAKKVIGVDFQQDQNLSQKAYYIGLLHECGRIILALASPEKYQVVRDIVTKYNKPLYDAEKEVFGATHSEIGAYLLALWGLPDEIVDTISLYHDDENCLEIKNNLITALHIANCVENQLRCLAKWE